MVFNDVYIQRCFDLARLGHGEVSPNPLVGAVIVHKDRIIGEGYHAYFGGPHAEINAIASVKDKNLLSDATIYVSLEPCHHHGKTPPCVDALLRNKFKNVVISVTDPNPQVMGKSIKKLKAHQVAVETHILEEKGKQVTSYFLTSFLKKRPYIILKYAKSSNNMLGGSDRQIWITNPYVKRLVHKWRGDVSAIMVGTNTALIDNPQLNNRLYFGNSPLRIVLDRQLKLAPSSNLLSDGLPSLVITEQENGSINKAANCEYLSLRFDEKLLTNILSYLDGKGLTSLIVEGGAGLLNSFIEKNLWDEARVFTGNDPIKGDNAIPAPQIEGHLAQTMQLGNNRLEQFFNHGIDCVSSEFD